MADASHYTGVFRVNPNTTVKRNRQPVSCSNCRAWKLKCNRQHPCENCTRRNVANSCRYLAGRTSNASRKRDRDASTLEAQVRLQRLEEMVQGFIESTKNPDDAAIESSTAISSASKTSQQASTEQTPAPQHVPPTPPAPNGSYRDGYFGPTYWVTVLETIRDVQGYLGNGKDVQSIKEPFESETGSLFDQQEPIDHDEAISLLPPRQQADSLIRLYFSMRFIKLSFTHSRKFQREYEAFWENPLSASLLWISMLFTLLCLGSIHHTDITSTSRADAALISPSHLMSASARCLVSGQYLNAQPHVVEALLAYAHCKFIMAKDLNPSLWSVLGLITRLAQRMGYHRDPLRLSTQPSAFESEMRRRVWAYIESFDLFFSFQLGMPAILHADEFDTEAPRNLDDEDLHEGDLCLPPSRPDTEHTEMLYYCTKLQYVRHLRSILGQCLLRNRPDYATTVQLAQDLETLHQSTPPSLVMRPMRAAAFTDNMCMIMHRFSLELMYLKSVCMLYRSYLSYGRNEPRFDGFRAQCLSAAVRILDLQAEHHEESRPRGRLFGGRWLISTLTIHDFLMAAMCVCVELLEVSSEGSVDSVQDYERQVAALRRSRQIWLERKELSRDAAHAATILDLILRKVTRSDSGTSDCSGDPRLPGLSIAASASGNSGSDPRDQVAVMASEHFTETNPQSLPMGPEGGADGFLGLPGPDVGMNMTSFENVLEDPASFDWHVIDNFLLDRASMDQPSVISAAW